ncbi:MAG: hypothetical protein H6622_03115 [Halobacteriovoraceae bacterium]|nr:hypothetical protein [Halobacteriovoraceae bacterium]
MNQTQIQSAINPTLINAISNVREIVEYSKDEQDFILKEDGSPASYDLIERLLTEELENTELDYNIIGEREFQRIFDLGYKALDGSNPLVENALKRMRKITLEEEIEDEIDDEYEEYDDETEEEEMDDSSESAEDILFEFINEILEEIKLNPDTDEDYLLIRFKNGLRTRSINVSIDE